MSISIKFRFFLSVVLITTLVVLYALLTLNGQQTTSVLMRDALSRDVAAMHLAADIKHGFVYHDDLIFRFLSTGDSTLLDDSNKVHDRVLASMDRLGVESQSPTVRKTLTELKAQGG